MKDYSSETAHTLSGSSPRAAPTHLFAKFVVLIFLFLGLLCPPVHGDNSIVQRTGYGSYGIITRIQNSTKRVVFQPMDGAFNKGFEISYYNFKGQVICKGRIKSIYRDEIYTNAEDCEKFENIRPGMGVAFNGDITDMLEIYENKGKLEAAIIDREWTRFPGVPKDLSEEQYEKLVLKSSVPVLVEFYATWCPYCKETVPVLGEIAKDLEGHVRVATLDKEKNATLSSEMNVKRVPAFFIVKEGKIIGNWSGAIRDRPKVLKYIRSILNIK